MVQQLVSPGVAITVNQVPVTPASSAGTVPMIFLATKTNKLLSDGVTIAPGTMPANAGQVYTLTSQRELLQTFGNPFFNIVSGTVQQGDETNELGLHAAWSYLSLANSVNVVRADLDVSQLLPSESAPTSAPANGTYWFDYAASSFGAFRANGNPIAGLAWNQLAVLEPTADQVDGSYVPLATFGAAGNIAVVTNNPNNEIAMYEKISTAWYLIGSSEWKAQRPTTVTGTVAFASLSSVVASAGTLTIDGITITISAGELLSAVVAAINAASIPNVTAAAVQIPAGGNYFLQLTDPTDAAITISGTSAVLTDLGLVAGTTAGYSLFFAPNTSVPTGTHAGDIWIKTTNPNFGANYVVKKYNSSIGQFNTVAAPLNVDDVAAEVANGLTLNNLYVQYNTEGTVDAPEATTVIKQLASLLAISVSTTAFVTPVAGTFSIRTRASAGATVGADTTIVVTTAGTETAAQLASEINAAVAISGAMPHVVASVLAGQLVIASTNGSAVDLIDGTNNVLAGISMPIGIFSNWIELVYTASIDAPTQNAAEGTLWFNPALTVDIMVNNGNQWVGYRHMYPATDPNGPQITSAQPTTQSTGNPLQNYDLWINSDNVVGYPAISVYLNGAWTPVDNTDHTTPMGIVFGDVRQDSGPATTASGQWLNTANSYTAQPLSTLPADLLLSDYVDPVDLQILNPQIFPAGIMLFNTEIGTDNVKVRRNSYFSGVQASGTQVGAFLSDTYPDYAAAQEAVAAYLNGAPGRWITQSGNDLNGVVLTGRFAQREVVVQALTEQIVSNQAVLDPNLYFNILACPGYIEVFSDLVAMNITRQETAFIITDVPATLTPDATSINAWATDAANVSTNGRLGRVTSYEYAAMYYPWGLGTNVDGTQVAIPSSTLALNVFGYNDRVGYVWTPPAGTRRGIVTNASSVGYIDINTYEYIPYNVNKGQRDTLYTNNINPIVFIPGQGLLVRGDKTLDPTNTDLTTRVNVARTVVYLNYILPQLLETFLFELNTPQTQASAANVVTKFLTGIMGQGALTDFAVVCDSSNNTPAEVAANELHIDIAVVPTFAIDFIYIGVTLEIALTQ